MSTASTVSAPPEISSLSLAQIKTDGSSQARVGVRQAVVRDYAAAMTSQIADGGLRFPPIVVFTDGQDYWVGDGFHRIHAARQAGLTEISAEIRPGTERDALLHSISANTAHGLPRSSADKRKAVALLLADPEWSQWSDREIARRCQVSNKFVSHMRRSASVTGSQMRERRVQRDGKVYKMSMPGGNATPKEAPSVEDTRGLLPISTDPPPLSVPPQAATPVRASPDRVPLADALRIPVPQERTGVFAALADFEEAKDLFGRLVHVLDRIAQGPAGQVYRLDLIRSAENGQAVLVCPALRAAFAKLRAAEPYCCYCPACHAAHPGRANLRCKTCTGRGWTSRAGYESSSGIYREQVLKLRSPTA
jgi:hypothetical protein